MMSFPVTCSNSFVANDQSDSSMRDAGEAGRALASAIPIYNPQRVKHKGLNSYYSKRGLNKFSPLRGTGDVIFIRAKSRAEKNKDIKTTPTMLLATPTILLATSTTYWKPHPLQLISTAFEHSVLHVWKIQVFYIAVYGPYKPYISHIRNTECSNTPEINCMLLATPTTY